MLKLTHLPSGTIMLEKVGKSPEEKLLDFLTTLPRIDWRKAWAEVKAERKREHR